MIIKKEYGIVIIKSDFVRDELGEDIIQTLVNAGFIIA